MPTRMIREGLLDSARYWSVSSDARQLFFHLLLIADDFGCCSAAPVYLRRRCFADVPGADRIARLLTELSDVDLIRLYTAKDASFLFIPRFGQRLRRMTLKHPRPVDNLLEGDDDAIEKFRNINGHTLKMTDTRPTDARPMTDTCPPEEKRSRREEKLKGSARAQTGLEKNGDRQPKTEPEAEAKSEAEAPSQAVKIMQFCIAMHKAGRQVSNEYAARCIAQGLTAEQAMAELKAAPNSI